MGHARSGRAEGTLRAACRSPWSPRSLELLRGEGVPPVTRGVRPVASIGLAGPVPGALELREGGSRGRLGPGLARGREEQPGSAAAAFLGEEPSRTPLSGIESVA